MDADQQSKFAIHEAAREGRSKNSFRPALMKLTDYLSNPAAVVESLLNVCMLSLHRSLFPH